MEHIKYIAKPRTGKRYRIFRRVLELRKKIIHITSCTYKDGKCEVSGIEKEYFAYSEPKDTHIITKNPKAVIYALTKKDEAERKLKKHA